MAKVDVTFDGKNNVGKASKGAQSDLAAFASAAKKYYKTSVEASQQFAVGVTAVGASIAAFAWQSVQAYNESASAQAQLNAVLESTHGIAGVTADQVNQLASAMQRQASIGDEATVSAANMVLTFTGISKEVFPDTIQAIADMATALNSGAIPSQEQMVATAQMVSKALNDPADGLTKLTRAGVVFTAEQEKSIKAMVAAGDAAGAQKIMLEELAKEYGGSAAAAGATFAGQMELAKQNFGDFQELVGQALVENIRPMIAAFNDWFNSIGGADGMFKLLKQTFDEVSPYFPLIAGAIAGGLAPAFISAGIAIAGALATLAPWMVAGAAIVALAPQIYEAYNNNFMGVKTAVEGASDKLQEFYNIANQKTQEVVTNVNTWWGSVAPVLLPIFEDIKRIAIDVWNSLSSIVSTVWNGTLKPVFENIINLVQRTFGEEWAIIGEAAKTLVVWWNSVIKPALTDMKNAWDNDFQGIRTITTTVFNTIMAVTGSFMNFVIGVIKAGMTLVAGVVKSVLMLLRGDWEGAWNTLKDSVGLALQIVWNTVKSALNNILAVFGTSLDQIGQAVVGGFNAVTGTIGDWWNGTIAFFAGLPGQMYTFGVNIITGMIDGIKSMAGAAMNAVSDTVTAPINWAKDFLGIHSPSKLMEQYGSWTMEGFTIGIKGAKKDTVDAMKDAMKTLVTQIEDMKASYTEAKNGIVATLNDMAKDHATKMQGFQNDINGVLDSIKKLKDGYKDFVSGSADSFGSAYVKQEDAVKQAAAAVQKQQSDLQALRLTGGSEEDISGAMTNLADLQRNYDQQLAIQQQGQSMFLQSQEQFNAQRAASEQALQEQKQILASSTDIQERAAAQARVDQLTTDIDYMKITEQDFAGEQQRLANAVAAERLKTGMTDFQRFVADMKEKRVQKDNEFKADMALEAEKLAKIQDNSKQEIELYNRKQQEIITRLQIIATANETILKDQTRVTGEQVQAQIDWYKRLEAAARAASAAISGAGVSSYSSYQHYATGGIVQGTGNSDTTPVMTTPGELILNRAQQGVIAGQLQQGPQSGGLTVVNNFEGATFLGTPEDVGDAILEVFKRQANIQSY